MDQINATQIILGLVSFIVLIISGGVRMLWSKVSESERKIERVKDKIGEDIKEFYKHHDNSSEKVRTEISNLATSLRKDMATHNKATTELLLQIAQTRA